MNIMYFLGLLVILGVAGVILGRIKLNRINAREKRLADYEASYRKSAMPRTPNFDPAFADYKPASLTATTIKPSSNIASAAAGAVVGAAVASVVSKPKPRPTPSPSPSSSSYDSGSSYSSSGSSWGSSSSDSGSSYSSSGGDFGGGGSSGDF